MWLLWVAVDCCFGLALVRCSHSMDLQPAGMKFRRAAILSPLSHTRCRLPQALAAQRDHGQTADPNSRAASAQSSVLQIYGVSFHGGPSLAGRHRHGTERLRAAYPLPRPQLLASAPPRAARASAGGRGRPRPSAPAGRGHRGGRRRAHGHRCTVCESLWLLTAVEGWPSSRKD